MSDTPKTDAFEALVNRPTNWWDFARELERENAALREKFMFAESEIILLREEREELREDKERLDWLDQKIVSSWLAGKDFVVWDKSSPQPCSIREWLDAARKEAQP